ncbi:MAG: hypothetical protein KFB97_00740 [Cyanobium sp. M30B3]|jgi:hypothetical protein|nr:MAG: hypothetical protein KFB97_00740 [Cyanobium sp. M30B3]
MAPDPLDALRLSLMQEVLPVGLAALERVRRGGPQELIAAFDGAEPDPLDRLRQEGEPAASRVREQLDQVSPGLGNPVMKVEVRDVPADPDPAQAPESQVADFTDLQARLRSIEQRLRLLEQRTVQSAETP